MTTNRLFDHRIIKCRTIKIIQSPKLRNIYNICDVQTPQYQLISSKALLQNTFKHINKIKYYRCFEFSNYQKIEKFYAKEFFDFLFKIILI